MSILSLFAPSLANGLTGGLIVALGIAIIVLTVMFMPFGFKNLGIIIGLITSAVGLFILFGLSFFENIFSNTNSALIFVGIIFLIILGYLEFRGKKRK